MMTRADNYARYLLSKLINALEQPYKPSATTTGMARLARALFDALLSLSAAERSEFLEEPHAPADLVALVERFADAAILDARFSNLDHDLIRALLYLLPEDARIRVRVLKWLRCEDLNRHDRELLGDLVPRPMDEMPLRTIIALGRLMAAVQQAALVLCVDQLEELVQQSATEEKPGELFRRAIDVLVAVTEEVPRAVVVVACLEDYYTHARNFLMRPKLDRLTRDPEPMRLSSHRTEPEIAALIAERLAVLYAESGAAADPANPLHPYAAAHVRPWPA